MISVDGEKRGVGMRLQWMECWWKLIPWEWEWEWKWE